MDKWLAFLNGLVTMTFAITLWIVSIADEVTINHIPIVGSLKLIVIATCIIVIAWNIVKMIRL